MSQVKQLTIFDELAKQQPKIIRANARGHRNNDLILQYIARHPGSCRRSIANGIPTKMGAVIHHIHTSTLNGWIERVMDETEGWQYWITPRGMEVLAHRGFKPWAGGKG